MRGHVRELNFSKVETGKPAMARCSACKRVFVAKPQGNERTDDLLLKIRAEFDAHNCNEDASQAAARVVKEATENH